MILLTSISACPIAPKTNTTEQLARASEKEMIDSSSLASEGYINEDKRAVLECVPRAEKNSDVTGESPNDWDQSTGTDETQGIDPVSTNSLATGLDTANTAVIQSTFLSTNADGITRNGDSTLTRSPCSSSRLALMTSGVDSSSSETHSATVISTKMPFVTQTTSRTSVDPHSTSLTTNGVRVDGTINASFEWILPFGDAEFPRSTNGTPSSPYRSPQTLLTVNNEAGGSIIYNVTCDADVDGRASRVLVCLVVAILVLLVVNTTKTCYTDWKNPRYCHKSKEISPTTPNPLLAINKELAKVDHPYRQTAGRSLESWDSSKRHFSINLTPAVGHAAPTLNPLSRVYVIPGL